MGDDEFVAQPRRISSTPTCFAACCEYPDASSDAQERPACVTSQATCGQRESKAPYRRSSKTRSSLGRDRATVPETEVVPTPKRSRPRIEERGHPSIRTLIGIRNGFKAVPDPSTHRWIANNFEAADREGSSLRQTEPSLTHATSCVTRKAKTIAPASQRCGVALLNPWRATKRNKHLPML